MIHPTDEAIHPTPEPLIPCKELWNNYLRAASADFVLMPHYLVLWIEIVFIVLQSAIQAEFLSTRVAPAHIRRVYTGRAIAVVAFIILAIVEDWVPALKAWCAVGLFTEVTICGTITAAHLIAADTFSKNSTCIA